jgi:hypothetical protein
MASLADALAAVIADATRDEIEPGRQFIVFPGFFWPVKGEALAGGTESAAFEFTHWVNMIPGEPPLFMMNGRFVWNEYRSVLEAGKVSNAQPGYAARFARAATEMDLGLVTTALNTYFPVDVVQSPWTQAVLSEAQIVGSRSGLPEAVATFMERFNTLTELGDALVASISYERATLVVLRGWFDVSLLAERFWDIPGTVISDGLDPPTGELPAIVAKLVIVRNLQIRLPAQTLPDVGPEVVFRRVDGEVPEATASRLIRIATPSPPAIAVRPLTPADGSVEEQVGNIRDAAAEQVGLDATGAPSGARKFHVPVHFDTAAAAAVTADQLSRAQTQRDAAVATVDQINARIAQLGDELSRVHDSGGPFGIRIPNPLRFQLESNLITLRLSLPPAQEALASSELALTRWQNAARVLEQLAAIPEDPNPYALALVCDRIPKSPNPDPALFA